MKGIEALEEQRRTIELEQVRRIMDDQISAINNLVRNSNATFKHSAFLKSCKAKRIHPQFMCFYFLATFPRYIQEKRR